MRVYNGWYLPTYRLWILASPNKGILLVLIYNVCPAQSTAWRRSRSESPSCANGTQQTPFLEHVQRPSSVHPASTQRPPRDNPGTIQGPLLQSGAGSCGWAGPGALSLTILAPRGGPRIPSAASFGDRAVNSISSGRPSSCYCMPVGKPTSKWKRAG